jgi:ERF superfamily protein
MNTSESTDMIATALASAQAKMSGAKKDATNPHFRSQYADLASVWEACREALTSNGIAVVQMTEPSDKDEVVIVTRLAHKSGQWYEGELHLPVSKADAQGYGSALTYARRYALAAAVGVAPEDDDGNAATAAKPTVAIPANVEGKALYEKMSDDERDFLRGHAKELDKYFKAGHHDEMVHYIETAKLDADEMLALWTLLASDLRSAFKRAKAKPNGAQLATQA